MPTLKAQVVFQGTSNKPEDVFVNTFHFTTTLADFGTKEEIKNALVEMYNVTPPGSGNRALALDMSNFVSRTANASFVKVYNLADAQPRIPTIFPWTLAAASGAAVDFPAEVAICVSYYAQVNQPRFRGRVFFGPWLAGVGVDDGTTNRAMPSAVLRDSVAQTIKRLVDKPNESYQLAVYSTVDNVARPVTAGWVDDAWDIQRRRGQDAANRTLWTAA